MIITRSKPTRKFRPRGIDANGHRLLEMCQLSCLSLVNGRLHSDRERGKSTGGMSTVDYVLTNRNNFVILKYLISMSTLITLQSYLQ